MNFLNSVVISVVLINLLSLPVLTTPPLMVGWEAETSAPTPSPRRAPAAVADLGHEVAYTMGWKAWENEEFERAEETFLRSKDPKAKSMLALMYLRQQRTTNLPPQHVNTLAEALLNEAKTPVALANLGRMYITKKLGGRLSRKERYELAVHFLTMSGTKLAQDDIQQLIDTKRYKPGCASGCCVVM